MPETLDTVNARLIAIKAKIKTVADEYEALLALVIAIAEVHKERTGRDLGPNEQISPEDEVIARRKTLHAIPKADA